MVLNWLLIYLYLVRERERRDSGSEVISLHVARYASPAESRARNRGRTLATVVVRPLPSAKPTPSRFALANITAPPPRSR